jgi:hypothetical protein
MKKRNLKRDNSGQVLIISALLVAMLLLSTALYVIETEKGVPTGGTDENDVFPTYKQSIKSTLISALANVTNGGDTSVLTANLDELKSAITAHSYQALLKMDFTPLNVAPYQNGIWISWGANGQGISSTYASFVFDSSGVLASSNLEYAVNVTLEVHLGGSYVQLDGNLKQVNLTVNVLNEGKPALGQSFTFYFELDGSLSQEDWVKVDSPSTINFGNGAYAVSFIAETANRNDPVLVSMHCHDQRGILVKANVTCVNAG